MFGFWKTVAVGGWWHWLADSFLTDMAVQGQWPFNTLNIKTSSLNLMHYQIDSQ